MTSEIVIALIGFLGTACGSMIGAFTSSRLTNYRLEQLEKRVERIADYSERLALLEQKEHENAKRIDVLEKKN